MAAISDRASNEPMPKPSGLVDAKGWKRRLRTKSPSIPQPLSAMAIRTSLLCLRNTDGHRLIGRTCFDGVLDQVSNRLLERRGIDQGPKRRISQQAHVMVAALRRDRV